MVVMSTRADESAGFVRTGACVLSEWVLLLFFGRDVLKRFLDM